jgi:hypothetical protein
MRIVTRMFSLSQVSNLPQEGHHGISYPSSDRAECHFSLYQLISLSSTASSISTMWHFITA